MALRKVLAIAPLLFATNVCAGGDETAVEAARQDLARRLNVPLERVEILAETPMTWPDTNLGCVRIGVPVEDIVTRGTRLILFAEGQEHYYHARPGEDYQYCVTPATKKRGPIRPPVQ